MSHQCPTVRAPKVSVCIPAYGQPDYFSRALRSVVEQDFTDFEVIVTDDSPDDVVAAVVDDVADPRVVYLRNDVRQGSPGNWNVARDRATGELVKFVHHDDWLSSRDSLGKFVRLLDQDPEAQFGFSASSSVDPRGRLKSIYAPASQVARLRLDPRSLLLGNWIGGPSATIFRRIVPARFDPRLRWVVDIDFYLEVLTIAPGFAYTEEPLVSVTDGARHQVTTDVMRDPGIEVFEWFMLYGKWAPRFPLRGDRARFLEALLGRVSAFSWRERRQLQLRGRAARLFVVASLLHERGVLARIP